MRLKSCKRVRAEKEIRRKREKRLKEGKKPERRLPYPHRVRPNTDDETVVVLGCRCRLSSRVFRREMGKIAIC